MAIQIVGAGSTIANVNGDGGLQVEVRPPAFGTLGSYCVTVATGSITATLAANSDLFSMRWTDATRFCIIRSIRASGIVTGTITTAVAFDLAAFIARSFTVSASGGTAVTLTGSNAKLATSMGTSLMGDMRASSTAALTAGTRTLDAQAIGRIPGNTGTVVGTQIYGSSVVAPGLVNRDFPGAHPILLATNEGLVIQNPLAGPASGTIQLVFTVEWMEVATY